MGSIQNADVKQQARAQRKALVALALRAGLVPLAHWLDALNLQHWIWGDRAGGMDDLERAKRDAGPNGFKAVFEDYAIRIANQLRLLVGTAPYDEVRPNLEKHTLQLLQQGLKTEEAAARPILGMLLRDPDELEELLKEIYIRARAPADPLPIPSPWWRALRLFIWDGQGSDAQVLVPWVNRYATSQKDAYKLLTAYESGLEHGLGDNLEEVARRAGFTRPAQQTDWGQVDVRLEDGRWQENVDRWPLGMSDAQVGEAIEELLESPRWSGVNALRVVRVPGGQVLYTWQYGERWRHGEAGSADVPTDGPITIGSVNIVEWGDVAQTDDYPMGRRERGDAEWRVEHSDRHGSRVVRQTRRHGSSRWASQKATIYGVDAKIGLGANGRVYFALKMAPDVLELYDGTMTILRRVRRRDDPGTFDALNAVAFKGKPPWTPPASTAPTAEDRMRDAIWERIPKDQRAGTKKDQNRTIRGKPLDQASDEEVRALYKAEVATETRPTAAEMAARLKAAVAPLFEGYKWRVDGGSSSVLFNFYDAVATGRDSGYPTYHLRVLIMAAKGFNWLSDGPAPPKVTADITATGSDVRGYYGQKQPPARADLKPRGFSGTPDEVLARLIKWLEANASAMKTAGQNLQNPPKREAPKPPEYRKIIEAAQQAGLPQLSRWMQANWPGLEESMSRTWHWRYGLTSRPFTDLPHQRQNHIIGNAHHPDFKQFGVVAYARPLHEWALPPYPRTLEHLGMVWVPYPDQLFDVLKILAQDLERYKDKWLDEQHLKKLPHRIKTWLNERLIHADPEIMTALLLAKWRGEDEGVQPACDPPTPSCEPPRRV